MTKSDADILIQLRGGDILWQKERLLNIALQHLPNTCRKLALVDCDVIFELDDFCERVSGLLDRFKLVQMFSHAHHTPRDCVLGDFSTTKAAFTFTRPSAAFTISSGIPPATCLLGPQGGSGTAKNRVAPGFAWAARRELFEQHRIYGACIVEVR